MATTIYDVLKKDHRKVEALLERLVHSADADDETRSSLITQIRDELVPHARAEEAVFYNSLSTIDEAKDLVRHGYTEHMEAETLLRTLQGLDAVNVEWTTVAKKLRDGILHHIEEEEGEIFTAAKQLLADEEVVMMAQAFEEMKPKIREGGFVANTLELVANMMPDRFATPLRNFLHK
jgi:hemerythrin-like domain-containing protein